MNLLDHLEKLKYFYEVARVGSMKKASLVVFISQPSLTKSIKILEDTIGRPLFIRRARGVDLTREGEILYNYCHTLFDSVSNMEKKLNHPDDPFAGTLRIGTYDSIAIYFWPKFLRHFLSKYKKLDLELTTGRSSHIQEMIEAGKLDFALIIDPKPSGRIQIKNLRTDSFKFFETTKSKKVYNSLEDAPLISMPEASAGGEPLKNVIYRQYGISKKVYTVSSLEAVKELTLQGIGIGLLPQMVANEAVKTNKLQEVKLSNFPSKGIGEHSIGIAYQETNKGSVVTQTLISEIENF